MAEHTMTPERRGVDDRRHAPTAPSRVVDADDLPSILRELGRVWPDPVVGVLDGCGPGDLRVVARVRTSVVLAEVRRRIGGRAVELLVLDEAPDRGLDGEPTFPLLPWEQGRAEEVAGRLNAALFITDPGTAGEVTHMAEVLSQAGCVVETLLCGSARPDPLLLAGRLHDAEQLAARRNYLRISGDLPTHDDYVLCDTGHGQSERVASAVDALAAALHLQPVYPPRESAPIDLLALLDGARLVVAASPTTVPLAIGAGCLTVAIRPDTTDALPGPADVDYGVPLIEVDDLDDAVRRCLDGSERSPGGPDRDRLVKLTASVEELIDGIVGRLLESRDEGGPATVVQQVKSLIDRARALEIVNGALQGQLARERLAMATYVTSRWDERNPDAAGPRARPGARDAIPSIESTNERLQEAQAEAHRLRAEIERIYATRTMRTLRPARMAYGRLRTLLQRIPGRRGVSGESDI